MTLKRLALILMTLLVVARVGLALLGSLSEPQVQGQLELYQTNLILKAAEYAPDNPELQEPIQQLLGNAPYDNAAKQYANIYDSTNKTLQQLESQAQQAALMVNDGQMMAVNTAVDEIHRFQSQIHINLGILAAHSGDLDRAQTQWQAVIDGEPRVQPSGKTAQILSQLWQESAANLSPDAPEILESDLKGWFAGEALAQFYTVTDQPNALAQLQTERQAMAETALIRLGAIAFLPSVGGLVGMGLILFLLGQWLLRREKSLLASPFPAFTVPWDGETTLQGIVVGFFFFSQIILATTLPLLVSLAGLNPSGFDLRGKALYILFSYGVMTFGGLAILYYTLRPYFPLPEGWFQVKLWGRWPLWGLGGYAVAIPLVFLASLINQQFWSGQGGGNPIILLALQSQDLLALVIFFITASLAAPIFEEIMFRGFLLPSLTRYLPSWGAIALTSVLFAAAHLSLAEMLPLTVLGGVLGFVYWRSRNLLASILLHSLWNSGTLISLFLLGR
ncbi:MAG: CPBP family intramembrane metalloprotease [Spirulina sp. DLM2.Bin59]|nr:MAG: CPBP family intramembrane metalloprotease [Spirulina sp. DLM2.Bin59]